MTVELAPIHVIGFLAGLLLVYQSVSLVRERKEGLFEFLLWAGFGVGLLAISMGSALTSVDVLAVLEGLLATLGFDVGRDSLFLVGNLVLLFLVFYTYVQLIESRKRLAELTQELALVQYELDQREDGED
jgi:hypothetical protein